MQKILHFSSLNAAVQAMRKGFVLTDDGNEGSWISTESLAKYIVHQYVKSINDNE